VRKLGVLFDQDHALLNGVANLCVKLYKVQSANKVLNYVGQELLLHTGSYNMRKMQKCENDKV